MKLAYLKKIHEGGASDAGADARMRGTEAQDVTRSVPLSLWQRQRLALIIAGGLLLVLLCAWLLHGWLATGQVITRERLRVATVDRGPYVRDVAAEGTVVAAVNPTLFAIAPGTVTYQVRAGDPVSKGQLLAVLDSPADERLPPRAGDARQSRCGAR